MSPLSLMACAGVTQAQFSFWTGAAGTLTPEALFGKMLREDLVNRGPQPVPFGGQLVAYLVAPEDFEMMEATEDHLAGKAIQEAYREQGGKPYRDLEDVLGELGL